MTNEEFIKQFGMTPEKAKNIMEMIKRFVNVEVKTAIANADYYMNPRAFGYEGPLKWGSENESENGGYSFLYEFSEQNSPESVFMSIISIDTYYGGMTSAMEACKLMGIHEDWKNVEDEEDYVEIEE